MPLDQRSKQSIWKKNFLREWFVYLNKSQWYNKQKCHHIFEVNWNVLKIFTNNSLNLTKSAKDVKEIRFFSVNLQKNQASTSKSAKKNYISQTPLVA